MKKKVIILVGIIIFFAIAFYLYFFAPAGLLSINPPDPVDNNIIQNIGGPTIKSWNTSRGRIYASICEFTSKECPDQHCLDGGTTYYDAKGNLIVHSGGMPPSKTNIISELVKILKMGKIKLLTLNVKPDYIEC